MNTALNVLFVEDSEDDVALILREMRKNGYDPVHKRVETAASLQEALQQYEWDLVISDHKMPVLDSFGALKIMHDLGLDIPFIIVSGAIGEETAVDVMKAGAHDYVPKNNLKRLMAAVEREIKEAEVRRQRREAEDALKESEDLYRSLIEQSNDAIYLLVDDKFALVNRRFTELLGLTAEEAKSPGFSFYDLVAPKSQALIRERHEIVARGEEPPHQYEFTAISKDGKEINVMASVSYISYKGQLATQGILHDITEIKNLEAQFRQAQKMEAVGRLAGGVAHDFNNLLSVINGRSELAMMSLNPEDPLWGDFKEIEQAASRAANLTRQLLAFSRKQEMEPKILSLKLIIADMKKMLQRIIGEDIELITDAEAELWKVKVDPGQIEQIIVNLAVNARDAMPDGGKLWIETRNVDLTIHKECIHTNALTGEYVKLSVYDNGHGMSEDIMARIFDPFFTTKSVDKGTGLGLATVYGIVKQSGGHICVHSEINKGTSFHLYLPHSIEKDTNVKKVKRDASVPRGTESILVVEDEDAVRAMATRLLKKLGYDVIEASDSQDAFLICQSLDKPVDLIIADLIMPNMNGDEFAEKVKKLWPDVKVMFMSGYAAGALASQTSLNPSVPYLQKPFRLATMGQKVRELLDH